MTFVFMDTETTGLDKEHDSIIQISGAIVTPENHEYFDFKLKPYKENEINHTAYIKTGYTQELINSFPDQKEAFIKLNDILNKSIDSNEKAFFIAYNAPFDSDFIRKWFEFNGDKYLFNKYFYSPSIDIMQLSAIKLMTERHNMRDFKLSTVYKTVFGEELENAHNALDDIKSTERLFLYFYSNFNPIRKVRKCN